MFPGLADLCTLLSTLVNASSFKRRQAPSVLGKLHTLVSDHETLFIRAMAKSRVAVSRAAGFATASVQALYCLRVAGASLFTTCCCTYAPILHPHTPALTHAALSKCMKAWANHMQDSWILSFSIKVSFFTFLWNSVLPDLVKEPKKSKWQLKAAPMHKTHADEMVKEKEKAVFPASVEPSAFVFNTHSCLAFECPWPQLFPPLCYQRICGE